MAEEACYTARATTKQQVLDSIGKQTLHANGYGQYTHDASLLLQKGIWRVLVSQFNPSNPGKGMETLLGDGSNILTNVKSTKASMAVSIINVAQKQPIQDSTLVAKGTWPPYHFCTEVQEEADQVNFVNQSVISTKAGVVVAITNLVGSNITNAILVGKLKDVYLRNVPFSRVPW